MNEFIKILPRDYLELGAEGKIEEAIAAIWQHVGEAKIYEDERWQKDLSKLAINTILS